MKHKEQLIAEARIWITDALDQIQKYQEKPSEYGYNGVLFKAQEACEQASKRLLSAQVVRF